MLGIDPHPGHCRIVRVRSDNLRPEILEATDLDPSAPLDPDLCRETEIALTLPDHQVIVKYLALGGQTADDHDRALFELSRSLTGSEQNYLLDSIPTGLDCLHLGLAVRRDMLAATMMLPYKALLGANEPTFALPRGLALAYGYLTFCVPASGNLVVLLDIATPAASIALIHNRNVVALANLPTDNLDLTVSADCERFAVELKTVVNFRLATLFGYGLTLPPAALVISDDHASDPLQSTLQTYFSMPILAPEINAGFLGDHLRQDPAGIRRFLAPLGLAAKSLAQ